MTIDRLVRGAKNFAKCVTYAAIGLTLSGCPPAVKERADIESYTKHRVGVVDLMSETSKYIDRKVSLTATPVESNLCFIESGYGWISVILKEEDRYLLCFSDDGEDESVAMADIILDTIVRENEHGRMLQAAVNGVLRKDKRGYWFELSGVKKIDEDIYLNVGEVKDINEWKEKKEGKAKKN